MKDKPMVSVIVPAYNASAYLAPCLDALLAQTLKEIEILVVDDGSDDDTGAILAAYAARDSRVRVIRHLRNLGVSAARNTALDWARGAFIGFCDADDWAEPGMYQALLNKAAEARAQIAFCAVQKHRADGVETVPLPYADGTVLDTAAIRSTLVPDMIAQPRECEDLPLSGYTPRNLFARDLVGSLRFDPDIRHGEDLLFIVSALLEADCCVALAAPLYHYRFHAASATKRPNPRLADSQDRLRAALTALFDRHGLSQTLAPRMARRDRIDTLRLARNLSLPDGRTRFLQRVRKVRVLLASDAVTARFQGLSCKGLPPKLAFKYRLVRRRAALALTLFYAFFAS